MSEAGGKSRFRIEHVFSAEIEPFKQAYIHRNFSPPLLFRDITEFVVPEDGDSMSGSTAYGASHDVPRDIDILAVGSSCVDFSPLNSNQQKDLHERKGKSKETFEVICRYVKWAKPRIVIFENVRSNITNWNSMAREFQNLDYTTRVVGVDTKGFYIPHTRKRRYMLCLNTDIYGPGADSTQDQWVENMARFQYRASAPVTRFLLPADDSRILTLAAWDDQKEMKAFRQDEKWEAARELHRDERMK